MKNDDMIMDPAKLEVKRNTHLGQGIDEVELYNFQGINKRMTCQEAMDLGVRLIRASRQPYYE